MSPERKALEAFARAYDQEEAACMGEPSPWVSADEDGDDEWKAERIVAARAGIEAYQAALSAPQVGAESVVKPLEWMQADQSDQRVLTFRAESICGPYVVWGYLGGGWSWSNLLRGAGHTLSDERAAKFAAQADYNRRILSALASPPASVTPAATGQSGVTEAGSEDWWNYRTNYGPDGEENYANVYAPGNEFVGNLKIHHARAIVGGLNAALTAAIGTPSGWRLVPEEPTLSMQNAGWREAEQQGIDINDVELTPIYKAMLAAAPTLSDGGER